MTWATFVIFSRGTSPSVMNLATNGSPDLTTRTEPSPVPTRCPRSRLVPLRGPLRDRGPTQPDHEHVTKRPHGDWTAKEMQVLSEQELRSRLQQAREAEARADSPGTGRSAKGRRLWRRNRELVEEEMGRRNLS